MREGLACAIHLLGFDQRERGRLHQERNGLARGQAAIERREAGRGHRETRPVADQTVAALVEQAAFAGDKQQGEREQPLAGHLDRCAEIGLHPGHRGALGIGFVAQVDYHR